MRLAVCVSALETLGVPLADGLAADAVLLGVLGLLGLLVKVALNWGQSSSLRKADSLGPSTVGSSVKSPRVQAVEVGRASELSLEAAGLNLELEPEPEPEPEPDCTTNGLVCVAALPPSEQVIARMLLHLANGGSVGCEAQQIQAQQIKKLLVDSRPRLDVLYPSSVGVDETILHVVARRGNALAIAELVAQGAPTSAENSNGATARDVAALSGQTNSLRALLAITGVSHDDSLCRKQGLLRMAPSVGWRVNGDGWVAGTGELDGSSSGVTFSWQPTEDKPARVEGRIWTVAFVRPCWVFGEPDLQFQVHCVNKIVLRLMADSETERDHWVRAITMRLAVVRDDMTESSMEAPQHVTEARPARAPPLRSPPRSRRTSMFDSVAAGCCAAKAKVSHKLLRDVKYRATPSERVTELLDHNDNGADLGVRGLRNKLPVVVLPGFCSSGLEVKHSEYMKNWTNSRVWFSLPKLARARTQTAGAKGESVAQSISITVHRACQLLHAEKDHKAINRLVVKLCLLSKKREKLAEGTTEPVDASRGQAEFGQSVLLTSNSQNVATYLHVSLIDEDTAEFEDEDGSIEDREHFGETTVRVKDFEKSKLMTHRLRRDNKAAGFVVIGAEPLIRARKSETREEASTIQQAQTKMRQRGTLSTPVDSATQLGQDEDEDEVIPKAWMQHMLLADDGHSDPIGIKVREVRGIKGCDYLQPDSRLMRTQTWVFGYLTSFLKGLGYGPHNLKAATYDWRLPPMFLEEQSAYFTRLIRTVEKMYEDAGNRPIVLLGHSMGCKMGHYFPNWVLNHGAQYGLTDPQAWLDKHIFSLFAIGGPFLGARDSVKALLSGDDMGIGDFIGKKNTIRLSRSFGSGMWLYPEGPLRTAEPYGAAYVRDKGTMRIEIASATFHNSAKSMRPGSGVRVTLTHIKTVDVNRRQNAVRTEFVAGKSVDSDGTFTVSGTNTKFNWRQKFQLVSEKLSLGDSGHEQLIFECEQQEGFSTSTTEAARQARSTLSDKSKTCWVGSIPDRIIADKTNTALINIFGEFGEIDSVTVRAKPGTNNSWAFIVFARRDQAQLAVAVSRTRKISIPADQTIGAVQNDLRVDIVKDEKMSDDQNPLWRHTIQSKSKTIGVVKTSVNSLFMARRGGDSTSTSNKMAAGSPFLKRVAIAFKEAKGLDIRDRRKQGKYYPQCFIAAEGVEWISGWLQNNHYDHGVSASNRVFSELHRGGIFELLEIDEASRKLRTHLHDSFGDAFIFCRMVQGGGSAILSQDITAVSPTSPIVSATTLMGETWKSTSAATMAAVRLQTAFRARRALQVVQRYTKVMTRRLSICAPDVGGQKGEVIGEVILRCVWHQTDPNTLVAFERNDKFEEHADGLQLLQSNGGAKQVQWHRKYYESDPNYLLNDTAFKPPPLKRLMHVYGTGLDTPWSFIYRSLDGVELKDHGPCSLGLELDPDANDLGDQNYTLRKGTLFETDHTMQRLSDEPGKHVRTCGDGTVPYQSLRFSKTWDSPHFLSQCIELTGKEHEHREILASKKFHSILAEYLTETVVIYILEGQDLPAMDAGGTSDPYCEVYCCDGSPTKDSTNSSERLKTKVVKKTLHPIFNERFVFGVQCDLSEMRQVVIDVYDSDHIGRDDMGTVTIDMQEIEQAPLKAIHGWCPLRDPNTGQGGRGALRIHAELEAAGQSSLGVKDNVAVAARCHLLANNLGGRRAVETVSWKLQDSHTQLWSSVNLFHGLSKEQKSEIKRALIQRQFSQGDVIVKQGDPSDAMYIIEEGVCEVSVCETIRDPCTGERTSDIVERALRTLVRGDTFGEMALLPGSDGDDAHRARTATVKAMTSVECLSLSREAFWHISNVGAAIYQSSDQLVAKGLLVEKV